jgi:protein-L-isoaspartate(D-aspartate) O-methyltransferase
MVRGIRAATSIDDARILAAFQAVPRHLFVPDTQKFDRVLEVGAGSGYAAALLGRLASVIHAIEIRPALAVKARQTLAAIGASNVHVHVADGSRGLAEHAPFDRILVSAGARAIPKPLLDQLASGGRIAIPVGSSDAQTLLVGERRGDGSFSWTQSIACMFVPLVDHSLPS